MLRTGYDYFFPVPKTFAEIQKENCKTIKKAIRELEREYDKIKKEEPKIIKDIKQSAQKNDIKIVNLMAKDLVQCRNISVKFYQMKMQLQSTLRQLLVIKSTSTMASAMKSTTRIMMMMSKGCDMKQMQNIMMMFERENENMEMKSELMNDTVNGVMEGDDDSDDEKIIISKILDEIGVDMADNMPRNNIKKKRKEKSFGIDSELNDRINNLKN